MKRINKLHRYKKKKFHKYSLGEEYIKKKKKEEDEEEIVKNTNVIVIEKKKMSKSMRELGNDIYKLFKPYSVIILVGRIKSNEEFSKQIKELKYQFITSLYFKKQKLFYQVLNCCTKLSVLFYVKSYTTVRTLKKCYINDRDYRKLKPLLILKNFNSDHVSSEMSDYLIIVQNVLRSVFPKVNLKEDSIHYDRRIVLYYYNPKDETIYFRQYVTCKDVFDIKKNTETETTSPNYVRQTDVLDMNTTNFAAINKNNVENKLNEHRQKNICKKSFIEIGPRISMKLYSITDQGKVIFSL